MKVESTGASVEVASDSADLFFFTLQDGVRMNIVLKSTNGSRKRVLNMKWVRVCKYGNKFLSAKNNVMRAETFQPLKHFS